MAGDLILQKAVGNLRGQNAGKLTPNWEETYQVTTVARTRAYYLEDMEEKPIPQPWNICNLKKYYP